ncbi:phage tail sheath C-terminal domain-containing protein [Coleofasciculus sp. FACHB-1120]|uniref:phage tail sheath family protein n=1 Tax=Coleofasciculus sp. FACHB-1120 TaxID=2692783 RepID=UPI001685F811|nr:phage tail sheath C-terminal domain-containing protein [Coleofasciculus sp. FACHB-1120]MBD2742219.1 phage tail sheath family protein [Coleofasciculus sp. FACHB-1120]
MPMDYFAPGVYVEEVDRGSRPIEGVSMSVAGFVGFTEDVRGDAELFKPMMITNWSQFLEYFAKQGSDGYTDFNAYLPFAVNGWFMNGGGRCWVTSIGTKLPGSQPPPLEETATKLRTSGNRPSLMFAIKPSEGEEDGSSALALPGGRVNVSILPDEPKAPEDPEAEPPLNTGEYFKVIVSSGGEKLEEYSHLTMNPDVEAQVGTYAVTAINEGIGDQQASQFLSVTDMSTSGQPLSRRPVNGTYEVSPPPVISSPERFPRDVNGVRDDRTGVQGIFEIDEVSMIACPDLMLAYQRGLLDLDQVHGIMEMMVSMCENNAPSPNYRMVVLDPPPCKGGGDPVPPEQQKPQHVAQWLSNFNRRSMFGALYYPWIKVANPRNAGRPILVPPCGHMMGIWCRTDETRGVFKAPANEVPRGVLGLAYETNFREQELLNPVGINCIRNFANYNRGFQVWGARTLVEPANVQWRYISVRRLISYIERSIEIGTQWVVFEPNDQDLWARVTRTVSNFLERLWRAGALFGGSPGESFYVKCDASINTHETIMLGRLYVEIGVCPVRPAEFVIFRISQWSPNQ